MFLLQHLPSVQQGQDNVSVLTFSNLSIAICIIKGFTGKNVFQLSISKYQLFHLA